MKVVLTITLTTLLTAGYAQWKHMAFRPTEQGALKWTQGFWADRFAVCRDSMFPQLWRIYTDPKISHAFRNFEIAAGLDTGRFKGPSFHDGDFYKTLEAAAAIYGVTKDADLDAKMDRAIAVIAKAQQADGYIYTRSIIERRTTGTTKMFDDKLSFEAYNFGHLMTAACVHFHATGKRTLLDIAIKAADFLKRFYEKASPEQARNAICPSHYMGLVELYRTTGRSDYLALVRHLVNIRGTVEGTDDNSDRAPFRSMRGVAGHAVRANYLFAGVVDLYSETGDTTLLPALNAVWNDAMLRKMYITGGCGALYDGVSVDGVSYNPDTVQKVHQSYGKAYQLPSLSAHNETCANIGNLLWNYRMLEITGEAKYADVMELALYNSILSGVSLNGKGFFYTNPLAASHQFPYHLRWEGGRQPYIALSNCCPPNAVRTIAEVGNYVYSKIANGLAVNLYGGSTYSDADIQMEQRTDYPWSGEIQLIIQAAPANDYSIALRIPGWCETADVTVNGKSSPVHGGQYHVIHRKWQKGDVIRLSLQMPVQLMESNPLVEETRNQVSVKRGPIVYCAESMDIRNLSPFSIGIREDAQFTTSKMQIANTELVALEFSTEQLPQLAWNNTLYRPLQKQELTTPVRLIPYFAWANRGRSEMSVWLPLIRTR